MKRRELLFSALLLATPAVAQTNAPTQDSTLVVRVTYAGEGQVNPSHKLYVAVWDTPDFIKDDSKLQPLDSKAVTSKTSTVQFTGLKKNPVFVSLVYDPAGTYDGNSRPPAGASLGLYSHEQGIPSPIQPKPGQTTSVAARLDDSTKVK
jgi:hypothetical protein